MKAARLTTGLHSVPKRSFPKDFEIDSPEFQVQEIAVRLSV